MAQESSGTAASTAAGAIADNAADKAADKAADIAAGTAQVSAMTPYQLPQPAESLKEIVIPSAIPDDERVWVPQAPNVWFRPLCHLIRKAHPCTV